MNINTTMDGSKATVALDGRLETTNSGSLEQEFSGLYDQVDELVVDCTNLEYISSSGLRTLLSAVKTMKKKGGFKLTHVSDDVMEILNVTGFADILTIE
ncbi:MAG: STAS domain-containing protein [Lachnospiraceae bacterium]|nr:STAS domain-containing protein [Lachnospiraceae bacterium]